MVEFPPHALASVPLAITLPGTCRLEVRLHSLAELSEACRKYGERLRTVELPSRELSALETAGGIEFPERVWIRIRVAALEDLLAVDVRRWLPAGRTIFHVRVNSELPRVLNYLADLNARIHILPRPRRDHIAEGEPSDEELLSAALQTFFHHPTLRNPIEPLGALLLTTVEGAGPSLWDTEREKTSEAFYVDAEGNVSLSERCDNEGVRFGTVDDSYGDITQAPPFRRFLSLRSAIFTEKLACVFCPHLRPCGGFFKALEPEADCSSWQHAFAQLAEEASNARELAARYGGSNGG